MKQIWDTDELANHWSLSFEEIQPLKSQPATIGNRFTNRQVVPGWAV
jgi:hypothetical protein